MFLSFYIDVESNGRSEGELENFSLKIVRIDNFDRRNLIINNDKNSLYHTYIYIYIIYNELIYFSILNLVDSAIVEQILIQSHFFFFVFLYTLPFRAQIIAFEREKKNPVIYDETLKIRHAYFGNVEPVRRGVRS